MKSHHSPEKNPDPATTNLVRKLPAKVKSGSHTRPLHVLKKYQRATWEKQHQTWAILTNQPCGLATVLTETMTWT